MSIERPKKTYVDIVKSDLGDMNITGNIAFHGDQCRDNIQR